MDTLYAIIIAIIYLYLTHLVAKKAYIFGGILGYIKYFIMSLLISPILAYFVLLGNGDG